MAAAAIHVVPDDNFDDWVVRAPTLGRNSATTRPEKPPNWLRRRSRKSARPNSSSTSQTEKRVERVLQKAEPPDCSAMIRPNRATRCYTFMPSRCSRVHASS
jgi:hypothetical protein